MTQGLARKSGITPDCVATRNKNKQTRQKRKCWKAADVKKHFSTVKVFNPDYIGISLLYFQGIRGGRHVHT